MMINNNWLNSAYRMPTPNVSSGSIVPSFIVMHYTASWSAGGSIQRLTSRGSEVSAHLVVDLDGSVTQLADFTKRTWHAGPSEYGGFRDMNSHAIGIEIVNIGFLRKSGAGFVDHTGAKVSVERAGDVVECPNPRVGSGMLYWPNYTDSQILVLDDIVLDIAQAYSILDVVSHEEIDTRGWKTDPGPAFPMMRYKKIIKENSKERSTSRYTIAVDKLNIRGGPGSEFPVIGTYRRGDVVEVETRRGDWAGIGNGWIHTAYLRATPQ
jgi:N-acetylmuramoyl-L-alanine amidase